MAKTQVEGGNPVLDSALEWKFQPWEMETGLDRVVGPGDHSHKCPVYVKRVPPCTEACPAGEDIRGYHNLLTGVEESEEKWTEAWGRIVEKNPFPAIMGRVCPAPCESGCNRKDVDETVGINSVEHAIGNYGIDNGLKLKIPEGVTESGKHVAVVGAGPAGLSAAYQLRRKGHKVTIYEAREKSGGMIRYGIMGYRVDRNVLEAECDRILELGIELKTGVAIGKDITLDELESKHDAVFLGIGAQTGKKPPIPGFDKSTNAISAIEFLEAFEQNPNLDYTGKKVLVLGDGDVAMDVVRLAIRLGAEAKIFSAVPREDMNCSDFEFDEAVGEGVEIEYKVAVKELVLSGDNISEVRAIKMQKKEASEEGANSPIPFLRYKETPGSDFTVQADIVVASIGQAVEMNGFENLVGDKPLIPVDPHFQVAGSEKIFAGGDAIKIDLITTAVGQGRKAAEMIDIFLAGYELPRVRKPEVAKLRKLHTYYYKPSEKAVRNHVKVENPKGDFNEVLVPLESEQVEAESARCMSCGLCFTCKQCLLYCPQEAIELRRKNPIGEKMYTDYSKCIGCHICHEVCPCGYIDMAMGDDL